MRSEPALLPPSKTEDTSLHTFYVHKDGVSAMHLVGDTLHSGSYDRSVASIDLRAAAAAHTFNGSLSMVHCIYADQSTVHVGNDDGEVLVVDAKSGAAAATIKAHKRAVLCMCVEEGMLYTGSKDCVIRQWDMRTRKCLKKIRVHSAPVTCVQMVDGAMYSGSWDGSLYTFANGEGRRQTDPKTTSPLLALTPAAGLMYAAYRDGRARVWAPGVEKVITTFVAHVGGIPAILVDEQARMYLGSDDRTISVWDLKMQSSYVDAEKCVCAYAGHKDGVLCLAKGETLLYSGSYDHSIKVWDLKAVDRALVPGLEERALPLHKLATEGAGMKERAARADPDWWKAKRPAGGPYFQPKLGLRFNQNVISPTVQEVFPGSVAEVADLQVGDVIKKINDFEVDTVVLLQECVAYLRPQEAIEMHYDKRMNNGSTKPITAKFSIEDLDPDVKDSVPSIVTAKQLLAGIYDVFDPEKSTAAQAVEFLEVVSKHADFFRQLMLKYSENDAASCISTRAFWLLLGKSKCVSPRFSLAELDRIFILNRIRQLYPHPRVEDIKNPHTHSGVLRIEDLIFGFVRLASLKYKKQADVVARFDRLLRKHLIPLALGEKPDVLTEAGLGNIDEVVQPQQQRAVLKLFVKFSGADAPEQALTGSGFMEAIKSLNLPPPGTSDEYLITVLEQCHKLYSRLRNAEPTDAGPQEDVLQREIVVDELVYCLAVIGRKVQGKLESTPLSEIADEFIDRFVTTSVR